MIAQGGLARVCLPALVFASACAVAEPPPATLAVDGRANANVSMAAEGKFVAAVWSAADESGATDVYSAVSADAGRSFAAPVRVNSTPGEARVNAEQPPRLALRARQGGVPEIAVVWTVKGQTGTQLVTTTSLDGGRSFAASRLVPGTDAEGNRGWEAIAAEPEGGFVTAWLDHRLLAQSQAQAQAQSQSAAGHAHGHEGTHEAAGDRGHEAGHTATHTASHDTGHAASSMTERDGVATAQLSQIYVGSTSGGEARSVAAGVCYCCKTAIAAVSDFVFLAWRHVYPGNMRDIAFTRSDDRGRTFAPPTRISEDNWHLEGCPDDGPTMGIDAERTVYIVWPSVVEQASGPVKSLFLASSDDGRRFTPRQQLPTEGQAHHPQIAVSPQGSIAIVWDESGSGTRQLASIVGRRQPDGSVRFGSPVRTGEVGMYPVVVLADGRWLRAWTTGEPGHSIIRVASLGVSE